MIDLDSAKNLVLEITKSCRLPSDLEGVVIIEEATIEKEYGWIFFYQSKKYLETRDIDYMLIGNGPMIVEKADGSIHRLGTALPIEKQIKDYEMKRSRS